MALIALAADKGAPGVTTASVALAAVWPRPVLLAECDPAGGDLVYRLPAADGGRLDPRRGLLNLAVAARRGLQPGQVWEHSQKLNGGLDVLAGVTGAEQGTGLDLLWGAMGKLLAAVPQADVIADCGRLGADGPVYDLLAHAACVVLLSRPTAGEVIRLRDRAAILAAALAKRGRLAARIDVVIVTDYRHITSAADEVGRVLRQSGTPARVVGGLAYEPKSAEQLRGQWGGRLDKSMFIRTARAIAADLAAGLPTAAAGPPPGVTDQQAVSPGPPPPSPAPSPGGAAQAPQPQHQPAAAQDLCPPPAYPAVPAAALGPARPAVPAAAPGPAHPAGQAPVTGPHHPPATRVPPPAAAGWPPGTPSPAAGPSPAAPSPPGRHAGAPPSPPQSQPQPAAGEGQQATGQSSRPEPAPGPLPRRAGGR